MPPLFSSSGIMNMAALGNQYHGQNAQNQVSGLNSFLLGRSDNMNERMLGSSVVGNMPHNYEMRDDVECQELVVGLQNGES